MDVLWISEHGGPRPHNAAQLAASKGFLWIDAGAEDLAADPDAWRDEIARLTGVQLHDLHLQDAANPVHPSYFDNTTAYEMVVFRRIVTDAPTDEPRPAANGKMGIPLLASLRTQPVSFFVLGQALITVRHGYSATCQEMKRRLAEQRGEVPPEGRRDRAPSSIGPLGRVPSGPAELMLRLLNGMVDKYLALRQPLTLQLDRWQRELLNPNGRFRNWLALLDARIVLRRLENICEEQYDALSELRDAAMDRSEDAWGSGAFDQRRDALLVRINDVMEHVNRVLSHARRMESSVETAVQLHFSATAHRTNEIMRILTVVTVIFMPLTLITGIFGMNVDHLPFVHDSGSFWWIMVGMALLALLLWSWFSARRFLEMRPYRVAEALARKAGLRAGREDPDAADRL
ncbi:magnesium transporter CorA family protein [Pigmentiphaga kullae]|uniref:Mg2+ and Co2+ transporter CorA n=1 Tax=Pigmentiphaga kullae TaxID=151784 RepID=A0A4Q7NM58_9BURK|nr:magnesium transporter CorA family protein [Pigmentiphaga kullae]RZS85640.1 Mg2+ and Co2+ transporter CorA [Pigmentiphaga kullae]